MKQDYSLLWLAIAFALIAVVAHLLIPVLG